MSRPAESYFLAKSKSQRDDSLYAGTKVRNQSKTKMTSIIT